MFGRVLKAASRLASPSVRQPIIKSLACFLLAAIVLQYSGILLLTQRYTMSRFYDVMLLVTNDSSNNTGSRRSLLQQGNTEKKLLFSKNSRQKHFIARYLVPPKVLEEDSKAKNDGFYDGNIQDSMYNMFENEDKNPAKTVPHSEGRMPSDTSREDKSVSNYLTRGRHKVISTPKSPRDLQRSRSSFMVPFWNIVNKIKNGLSSSTNSPTKQPLEPCKLDITELEGIVSVIFSAPEWSDLEKRHKEVKAGGHWSPPRCQSQHKVALVIPFRDRDLHLRVFLQHIHPFLQKQLIDYTIFVIEQTTDSEFNRAMLMNIGFAEGEKLSGFDCYIFHDVDLLPETLQNLYNCPHLPRHMSAAIDTFGYRLPYNGIFGGVSAMRGEHFKRVNGFSNCFFGWGGEDDDMYNRIKHHGLDITRYPLHVARYRMISHKKQDPSDDRFRMLNTGPLRFGTDGLSNLKYEIILREHRPLYTLIKVKINKADVIPLDLPMDATPTPPNGNKPDRTATSSNQNHRAIPANGKQEDNPSSLTQKDADYSIYDNHVSNVVKDTPTGKRSGAGKGDAAVSNKIEARLNQVLHMNGDSRTLSNHRVMPPSSPSSSKTGEKGAKNFKNSTEGKSVDSTLDQR